MWCRVKRINMFASPHEGTGVQLGLLGPEYLRDMLYGYERNHMVRSFHAIGDKHLQTKSARSSVFGSILTAKLGQSSRC